MIVPGVTNDGVPVIWYVYVPSAVSGMVTPDALFASGTGGNVIGPLSHVMVQLAPELTLLKVTIPPTLMSTLWGPKGDIGL